MTEFQYGDRVRFAMKVYEPPYAPHYDAYRDREFTFLMYAPDAPHHVWLSGLSAMVHDDEIVPVGVNTVIVDDSDYKRALRRLTFLMDNVPEDDTTSRRASEIDILANIIERYEAEQFGEIGAENND